MKWFSSFLLRRARVVLFIGTLLAIIGGYYTVQLYKNLRTDILELLPTSARSFIDLDQVTGRLESIDNIAVLVFSKDTRASKKFVIDLANLLEKEPKDVVASVDYRLDKEISFFKQHQALYIDLVDLLQIRNYIRDRIAYEKELYNPLNIFKDEEIEEPTLDFPALQKKYDGKTSRFDQLPEGFYATPDETIRAIKVNMPGKGVENQWRLRRTIDKAIAQLNPATYSPELQIKFTGGVEDSLEEQEALVEDLELSTVIVTILVLVGMLVFFRTIRATMALMASLFMGTFWTFGVSYYVVGYLNANSAFLGSIVIGNGINFGIIYLARYLEERRQGLNPLKATRVSMIHTAHATWTAALAAGLSYGSLILTGFRGFKQFGVIGLIGMVLCWISAFTVLPAMLIVLDKKKSLARKKAPKAYLASAVAGTVGRFPKIIWGISLLLTLFSFFTFTRFDRGILETDLSKLRNKESMEKGSAYLTRYLDEIFQSYLSPLVILPKNREDARRINERLLEIKEKEGEASSIAAVHILDEFIPSNQPEKIQLLKEIKRLLPPKMLRRLSEADRERVQIFLNEANLKPITQSDLPPLVLSKFTEKDGSVGKMVLVEPPLNHNLGDGQNLIRFIDRLRNAADEVAPGTPVAGQLAISSDMIRAITLDGPRATLCAFLAVVVLVILLFRNMKTIGLVLVALFLGVIWLAGIILGFDLKINFLNFIALPITFGIGVDYGVNIFQRYREEKGKDILGVIKSTGSAVGLCSFSTIVGYTSLLIAGNQGFVSFGLLAVAGEVTCILAAVISLPAFLTLFQRSKKSSLL